MPARCMPKLYEASPLARYSPQLATLRVQVLHSLTRQRATQPSFVSAHFGSRPTAGQAVCCGRQLGSRACPTRSSFDSLPLWARTALHVALPSDCMSSSQTSILFSYIHSQDT